MRVLVVDNYDSFVFNLVQYLGQLGVDAQVWRNDDPRLGTAADIAAAVADFDGVLLSPGPGTPERAGASIPIVKACAAAGTPLLGVCLGHQAIGVAFGGTVDRAPELLHGHGCGCVPSPKQNGSENGVSTTKRYQAISCANDTFTWLCTGTTWPAEYPSTTKDNFFHRSLIGSPPRATTSPRRPDRAGSQRPAAACPRRSVYIRP